MSHDNLDFDCYRAVLDLMSDTTPLAHDSWQQA